MAPDLERDGIYVTPLRANFPLFRLNELSPDLKRKNPAGYAISSISISPE